MQDRVRAQFGRAAEAYNHSRLFAQGEDLEWLVQKAALQGDEIALDVGTAAGHTAFALAPHVRHVVGLDITPAMIEVARGNANERGLDNFEAVVAAAEALPFDDASFDIVTCRYTAHHFDDPLRVLEEVVRVLRPGGRLVVVDNIAPSDPFLDNWINKFERLRDPSHVRELPVKEWGQLMVKAGFSFQLVRTWMLELDFEDWVARQQTPLERAERLRFILATANSAVKQAFDVKTSSFSLLTALMIGVREADRPSNLKGDVKVE